MTVSIAIKKELEGLVNTELQALFINAE